MAGMCEYQHLPVLQTEIASDTAYETDIACNLLDDFTTGSWQAYTTVPFDTSGIWMGVDIIQSVKQSALDISVGGAGSEVVVVDWVQHQTGYPGRAFVPIELNKGDVVRLRGASNTALTSNLHFAWVARRGLGVQFSTAHLCSQPWGQRTVIGKDASFDFRGTQTGGTLTQISSSTPHDCRAIALEVCIAESTMNNRDRIRLLLYVGPAASEVHIATWWFRSSAVEIYQPWSPIMLPVRIPKGTRVSAMLEFEADTESIAFALLN